MDDWSAQKIKYGVVALIWIGVFVIAGMMIIGDTLQYELTGLMGGAAFIAAFPRTLFAFSDSVDDDAAENRELSVRVSIRREGETLHFAGLPSFAPELLQTVRPDDPVRAKHLGKALLQLAEEGAASVFKTHLGSTWVVGVVGALQFDVLADRVRTEYDVPVRFEGTQLYTARWVEAEDPKLLKEVLEQIHEHDDRSGPSAWWVL